jgi:hypothetical protein
MYMEVSPLYIEPAYLLRDGNAMNLSNLTAEDIPRANELYGLTAEFVRGRITHKKASRAIVNEDLVLQEKWLTLYTNIMHVDNQNFLITICNPLQITLQVLVYLLVLYVDDILIVPEREELIKLREGFTKEFHWITMVINNEHTYLGETISRRWRTVSG